MLNLPVKIYHDGNRGEDYYLNERLYEDDNIFVGTDGTITVMINKDNRSCHGFYNDNKFYFDSLYYYMDIKEHGY